MFYKVSICQFSCRSMVSVILSRIEINLRIIIKSFGVLILNTGESDLLTVDSNTKWTSIRRNTNKTIQYGIISIQKPTDSFIIPIKIFIIRKSEVTICQ